MNFIAKKNLILILSFFIFFGLKPDNIFGQTFTKADSLRGNIYSPLRTCYDVTFYHLSIDVNIDNQEISGYNEVIFIAKNNFKTLQLDLFKNMRVEKIMYKSKEIDFTREENAIFIHFPKRIKKDSKHSIKVYYAGKPLIAKNAPWDGGFTYSKHQNQTFIATSCEGIGASLWWPNKDALNDEPDSMLISVSVPDGLINVSNGKLKSIIKLPNNRNQFNWEVKNPINNYCVALNIANYANFSDVYYGIKGNLPLTYYVLPENLTKAKQHFEKNVKPMLKAFEYWFGAYPFYNDGYKLVETPFLGMEHQSSIAYGNRYQNGYMGKDLSGTGWGLNWDFIIIHESGHEWFGNNISAKDVADAWIHESFTTYSEALFVEYYDGKKASIDYLMGLRKNILNDEPILGTFGVNKEGSEDRYYKGANLLHLIRTLVNNDSVWRKTLVNLNQTFAKQTVTGVQIIDYINKETNQNFTEIFKQYLNYKDIPTFCYQINDNKIKYWWKADNPDFNMPIYVEINGENKLIYPSKEVQETTFDKAIAPFKVSENFYIHVLKQ